MIKCFRCDQEISRVEDIARIVRKNRDFSESRDFCFCRKCAGSIPGLMEDELAEWYQLISAAECILDFSHTASYVFKRNMSITSEVSDNDMEYQEGEASMAELEAAGAFSDEGIMPGSHFGCSIMESELEDISRYFKGLKEIGNAVGMLREAFELTAAGLAGELRIPAHVIESIESGKEEYTEKMNASELIDMIKGYFHSMLIKESEKKFPPFI